MSIIVQSRLPFAPWMSPVTARLPGVQPVVGPWLAVDDAYAGQMARRDQLIARVPQDVLTTLPEGQEAAAELYAMLLDLLRQMPGFRIGTVEAERPDGQVVALDAGDPLRTLGRLVQEDLCLLQKQGDEHVLTGAVLCFPASWSLRPDQPLWRMNALVYANPELHQPRREEDPRSDRRGGQFLRAERQTLLRLPLTGAVLFAIHTYVVPLSALTEPERQGLDAARL